MHSPNIIWISSYPKSGNTWVRMFQKALHTDPETGFDLHYLPNSVGICNCKNMYRSVGAPTENFRTLGDVMQSRVPFQRQLSKAHAGRAVYMKTHAINAPLDGIEMFDPSLAALAVVIVRNPFDVVASHFSHFGGDREQLIAEINLPNRCIDLGKKDVLPVMVGSWRLNVLSWIHRNPMPKVILRYEDLHGDDGTLWNSIARDIFCADDPKQIEYAIRATQFGALQQLESETGFREKHKNSDRFFARGEVGYGYDELNRAERDRIWEPAAPLAERLGYSLEGGALKVGEMNADDLDGIIPALLKAA